MIRSEHSIVTYDFVKQQVVPDRLLRGRDAVYLQAAETCLAIYRQGVGDIRQDLHGEVEDCLGSIPGCPPRRIAAFCKLLDDAGEFAVSTDKASALRKRFFSIAAPMHPIVEQREGIFESELHTAQTQVAQELGLSWQEIEDRLFDDVVELQKLKKFSDSLTPGLLLSRYNLSQTQAALYRATQVRIDTFANAPTIIRRAKLAGLMHRVGRIRKTDPSEEMGYRMILDGPVSSMRESTRYGIGFAKLLPTLLACEQWDLLADVIGPQNRRFELRISPLDRLSSEVSEPAEFDSELERRVASLWESNRVEGWTFSRDQEFLVSGQQVFTPDFSLRNDDGQKIYIEVVGFWTPEYLQAKYQRLEQFTAAHQETELHWLLMFDRPPLKEKKEMLEGLGLPSVVLSKSKDPHEWIRIALSKK